MKAPAVTLLDRRYPHLRFAEPWTSAACDHALAQCDRLIESLSQAKLASADAAELETLSIAQAAEAISAKWSDLPMMTRAVGEILRDTSAPLSVEVLTAIHDTLGREIVNDGRSIHERFSDSPGKIREGPVMRGSYRPPDAADVRELLGAMVTHVDTVSAEGRSSAACAIVKAAMAHAYLKLIQPFHDGNGRTGAIAGAYLLARAGMPVMMTHVPLCFYRRNDIEYEARASLLRPWHERFGTGAKVGSPVRNPLASLIQFAALGFRDGLVDTLRTVRAAERVNEFAVSH